MGAAEEEITQDVGAVNGPETPVSAASSETEMWCKGMTSGEKLREERSMVRPLELLKVERMAALEFAE